MRNWKRVRMGMAAYCCLSLVATQPICWAQQAASAPHVASTIQDIALTGTGTLQGHVVGAEGQSLESIPIRIQQGDITFVETLTDSSGQFSVNSMKGGVYELHVNNQRVNVRVWAPNTAPPNAFAGFTYVLGDVQRGQCTADSCTGSCGGTCGACGGGCGPLGFLMNPWVIGAAVAAAIAIPLAVNNDDDDGVDLPDAS